MKSKLQTKKIFLSILVIFILSCGPTIPTLLTPADPNKSPDSQPGGTQTDQQASNVISADNAKDLVEISTWGKGSGHNPTYSPDGKLLAVSSSSGIYLYDSQSLQESIYFPQSFILDIAFSPDGKTLSAVSDSGTERTVKQWDVASGSELHSWIVDTYSNDYSVSMGVLSPDAKTLAIIFDFHSVNVDDITVKLWDVASEQELQGWNVYFPSNLVFSPDSKTLAIVAGDGTVTLSDVSSGSQLRTVNPGAGANISSGDIISLAFSPDGRSLAFGLGPDKSSAHLFGDHITLLDVASGRELRTLNGPTSDVLAVAFSPDGKTLASGTVDTIKLWDAASGNELLTVSASNLESLTFSPDGKTLVTASSIGDDSVKLWDATTGSLLNTIKGDDAGYDYIFSADSRTLAYLPYTYGDNTVRLRDVAGGGVRVLSGHPDWVQSLAFSPDGRTLASGSNWNPFSPPDNLLKLWDVASGQELHTLNGHTSAVTSVDFSPDGKTLASGSADNTVKLWDVASGSEVRTLNTPDYVYSVAFSPDGKTLASGSGDNTIKLWDVANGSELRILSGHTKQVISITFSPDGKELVSQSYDGNKLWDVTSGQELATLSTAMATSVISPDGKALAIGFQDGTVKVLDPANGNELYTLTGHTEIRPGLAFTPDGKILATGGENIKLWDAASGQELASFNMNNVYSLDFSPDGKLILAGSGSGMSLWEVQP